MFMFESRFLEIGITTSMIIIRSTVDLRYYIYSYKNVCVYHFIDIFFSL